MSKRLILVWLSLFSALQLLVWAAQCEAAPRELHQVSGALFSLAPVPPEDNFRYGPFEGLTRDARFERLVARFAERLANKHVPGGAIAVVLDGQLAYSAGVGVLRSSASSPVTAESRFRTASLSKMVIAATIMSLVEHDGLDLDAPLKAYLPYLVRETRHKASEVTLRMLLEHTGGIRDIEDARSLGLRPLIEAHSSDPLLSPPGRLFNYSNTGYALLAAVIERTTGRSFEDVVGERVFVRAQMASASYASAPNDCGLSAGHDARGRVIWSQPRDSAASRAAGGVIASVVDYARWAEILLAGGGAVLNGASVRAMMHGHALMQDEPPKRYGLGLFETEQASLGIVEHAGSSSGFSTLVRLVPSRGFAVVIFDNGTFAPDDAADAAMSAFLGPESPRERVVTPAESWTAFEGHYEDRGGALGRFDVRVREGRLWLEQEGGQRGQLPRSLRGRFEKDENGRVEYFVTRLGVAKRRR